MCWTWAGLEADRLAGDGTSNSPAELSVLKFIRCDSAGVDTVLSQKRRRRRCCQVVWSSQARCCSTLCSLHILRRSTVCHTHVKPGNRINSPRQLCVQARADGGRSLGQRIQWLTFANYCSGLAQKAGVPSSVISMNKRSVDQYVYVYTYMCMHMYTWICVWTCILIYTYMHEYMYMYI